MIERHAFWELYPKQFGWSRIAVYILTVVAVGFFIQGLVARIRLWKAGRPAADRFDNIPKRIGILLKLGFAQVKILRKPFSGLFHSTIFWGFVVLFIGTATTTIDEDMYRLITGEKFIRGNFYIGFSFFLDIFGLLALFGIALAAWRRYLKGSDLLDNRREDVSLLVWIVAILFTGFLSEALRISLEMNSFEKGASPIGYLMALPFAGLTHNSKMGIHAGIWFSHMFLSLAFIAMLPRTKALHIVSGWFNVFTSNLGPKGKLPSIPNMMERMEAGEDVEMGYKSIADFTWKDRLMLDACTRCGRCQDVCPAYNTGKHLNPKYVIQDARPLMLDANGQNCLLQAEDPEKGAIKSQVLWDCTNCMACMEACPVMIEHIPLIVNMRRELAMEFDDMGKECRLLFKNMDVNANPWGMAPTDRGKWANGLEAPTVFDNPEFEYLFFVGCLGSYDQRSQKIAQALVKIFNEAKINFAILGEMELCCGDPIRRLGNEASFQAIVGMTKEMLAEAEVTVRKAVVMCPHCFNTLQHEYKDFGLDWEVIHHADLIDQLIRDERIQLDGAELGTAVFHDSCFLGRYNDIYDAPRRVLKAAGASLIESERSRENGFCCGGGGGRTWLEEEVESMEDKINVTRVTQLASTGAKTMVSACPYCMMMFDEGTKLKKVEKGDPVWNAQNADASAPEGEKKLDLADIVQLKDLAEVVADGMKKA